MRLGGARRCVAGSGRTLAGRRRDRAIRGAPGGSLRRRGGRLRSPGSDGGSPGGRPRPDPPGAAAVRTAGRGVGEPGGARGGFGPPRPTPRGRAPRPPLRTGDGHRSAARAGAALADLDQAWWAPMAELPGDTRDGRPVGRLIRTERQGPGSIVVDATGRRFADESQDYNSFIRAYFAACERDPDRGGEMDRSRSMYVVFDQRFLDRFGFISHRNGQPVPDWLTCRDSVRELAEALPAEPHQLAATIERFNSGAVEGKDPDVARGADRYDRYGGDPANPWPNPCLAPIDRPPF